MEMPEKMKIAGVICELNPLHNGHRFLLEQARREHQAVVCVLSGCFVQRGEPALLDKWARTRLALAAGADLVLELPVPWACAGAERFAAGGVALLGALGCVDTLVFGSETGESAPLLEAARVLLSEEYERTLRALPETGEPFAVRRQRAVARVAGEAVAALLERPNDILGVEYCKALLRQGSPMKPAAVKRRGAGHDEAGEGAFLSGSQLRERLLAGEPVRGAVPAETERVWAEETRAGRAPLSLQRLEGAVLARLRTLTAEDFAGLPEISEGLEHRLYRAAGTARSLEEFTAAVKTRRYSLARVRRLMTGAFLGLRADLPALPPYLRLLGMSPRGEQVLGQARPTLPVLSRAGQAQALGEDARRVFALECRADDLAGLAAPTPWPRGRTCTEKVKKSP